MTRSHVIGIDASRLAVKRRTGTETYTFQLLQAISKLGPPEQFRLYLNSTLPPEGLPAFGDPVCIPFPRLWTHGRLSAEMVRHRPDLLFVPAHVVPFVHPRSVVTIHDLGYLKEPDAHPPGDRRMLDLSTRWSVRTARRVIAISETTKSDLVQRYSVRPDKIDVVHHGVSESFSPATLDEIDRIRTAYKLPERYVLALGTIQPRKNYARLAQAIAMLGADGHAISLVIAGKRGWMADHVENGVAAANADARMIGHIDDEDLPGLYSGAFAFCQPSLYEGFGMPLLEAMACGTPVVSSNRSSLPEIGGDAALYVDPFDPASIAAELSRLLSDDELRQRLTAEGRLRAADFTWERTARQTLDVLRKSLRE